MTLFFVLSGFVIHYNYNATSPVRADCATFFVARFARLYPLYIVAVPVRLRLYGTDARGACGRMRHAGRALVGPGLLSDADAKLVLRRDLPGVARLSIWTGRRGDMVDQRRSFLLSGLCRRSDADRTTPLVAARCDRHRGRGLLSHLIYFWCAAITRTTSIASAWRLFGPAASTASGYDNSLLRWLLYFNPAARLGEFLAGLAAAQLYLAPSRRAPATLCRSARLGYTLIAISGGGADASVALWHDRAHHTLFIGRIASPLYGPLVATMTVFLIARYDTRVVAAIVAAAAGATGRSELFDLHAARNHAVGVQTARPDDDRCRRRLGHLGRRSGAAGADQPRLLRAVRAPGAHVASRAIWRRRSCAGCSRRRTAEQSRAAARFRRQIELMDLRVVAAAPIGGEILAAAVGRVAELYRVDGEHAGRLASIAGACAAPP